MRVGGCGRESEEDVLTKYKADLASGETVTLNPQLHILNAKH